MERLTESDYGQMRTPPPARNKSEKPSYESLYKRLAAYEETGLEPEEIELLAKQRDLYVDACGELPIKRILELAQANREGRCVVLPCKIFDKVWNIAGHYQFEVTEIDLLPYGNILFRCGNKGTDDYAAFYGDDLGDTFSLEEPPERNNRADAEAALSERG